MGAGVEGDERANALGRETRLHGSGGGAGEVLLSVVKAATWLVEATRILFPTISHVDYSREFQRHHLFRQVCRNTPVVSNTVL